MAIVIPSLMPDPIVRQRRVRNGMMPSAMSALLSAQRINYAAVHGLKKIHQDSGNGASYAGISLQTRRGAFHSSETPGALYAVCEVACRVNQEVAFYVNDGMSSTSSGVFRRLSSDTSATTTTFNDLARFVMSIAIDADTAYTWRIEQSTPAGIGTILPISSCNVYEWSPSSVDVAQSYVVNPAKYFAKGPIYDADLQKLFEAAHEQWKHGPQLISISAQSALGGGAGSGGDEWATTSASYVNMLVSSASTTVSSATPGFNLPLNYHCPYHTTNVSATLAVYARQDTGTAANDVKLVDASGDLGTLSNFSNSAYEWKTTSVTLTGGASQKVDLQFRCDGTNTLRVGSACLYVKE